ncbi:hypothetical protein BH11VER1_BH11VER1_03850 [soil metagenome]
MISLSQQSFDTQSERFSLMLAHFVFSLGGSCREHSILCRVLDGRDLVEPRATDLAILTFEERAHYHAVYENSKSGAIAVRTRAALRRMLAREIGGPPHLVPIRMDAHGKPHCPHPLATGLDFSVSHADDCSMIALGEADGLGVDVEKIIHEEPTDVELGIVFNQGEYRDWSRISSQEKRLKAFTQAWTIKDAALKAIGLGLDGSTHEITVRFDARGDAWPVLPSTRWVFERINFCPCYAASFVALLPDEEEVQAEEARDNMYA